MPKTKEQKRQEAIARNLESNKKRQVRDRDTMLAHQRGGVIYRHDAMVYGTEFADKQAQTEYQQFVQYYKERGLDPHGNEL